MHAQLSIIHAQHVLQWLMHSKYVVVYVCMYYQRVYNMVVPVQLCPHMLLC